MINSIYNSTEDLKITYLLGAGASYYSNPIWKAQGQSMINVAEAVLNKITTQPFGEIKKIESLVGNETLIAFFNNLKNFGKIAIEYGSIDIYAKRLTLIGNKTELNELKNCLSVYYDIWESFFNIHFTLKSGTNIYESDNISFDKIDKRYFALLSILLEKGEEDIPKLSNNVSFLTWNYDLQLESSFETFLPRTSKSFDETNNHINFMNLNDNSRNEVIHLNGYRGFYKDENNKNLENVTRDKLDSLEQYLQSFIENFKKFKTIDYSNSINYAWEVNSKTKENARKIMSQTNILVIIGYSFPAFNRKIDTELIKEFEKGEGYKKVYYQDPFGNQDLIKLLFSNPDILEIISNSSQFHIPHEFLYPSKGEDFIC